MCVDVLTCGHLLNLPSTRFWMPGNRGGLWTMTDGPILLPSDLTNAQTVSREGLAPRSPTLLFPLVFEDLRAIFRSTARVCKGEIPLVPVYL